MIEEFENLKKKIDYILEKKDLFEADMSLSDIFDLEEGETVYDIPVRTAINKIKQKLGSKEAISFVKKRLSAAKSDVTKKYWESMEKELTKEVEKEEKKESKKKEQKKEEPKKEKIKPEKEEKEEVNEEIAKKKLGLSRTTFSKIQSGEHSIKLEDLEELHNSLKKLESGEDADIDTELIRINPLKNKIYIVDKEGNVLGRVKKGKNLIQKLKEKGVEERVSKKSEFESRVLNEVRSMFKEEKPGLLKLESREQFKEFADRMHDFLRDNDDKNSAKIIKEFGIKLSEAKNIKEINKIYSDTIDKLNSENTKFGKRISVYLSEIMVYQNLSENERLQKEIFGKKTSVYIPSSKNNIFADIVSDEDKLSVLGVSVKYGTYGSKKIGAAFGYTSFLQMSKFTGDKKKDKQIADEIINLIKKKKNGESIEEHISKLKDLGIKLDKIAGEDWSEDYPKKLFLEVKKNIKGFYVKFVNVIYNRKTKRTELVIHEPEISKEEGLMDYDFSFDPKVSLPRIYFPMAY